MPQRKIAVIGTGKIAQDQHLPVIAKSGAFVLAATVNPSGVARQGVPVFTSAADLYAAMPEVDLVSICTPPGVRHALACQALRAGKHVLLEKPPATTISEFDDIVATARAEGRVLFQTWHSQYNAAVDAARKILAAEGVADLRIDWRESVRKWHPGQDWVWQPGGFGVCDPGINALSIFTRILPFPAFIAGARMAVPSNRQTPVDVELTFGSAAPHQPAMSAGFNWLEESGEVWTISITTQSGRRLALEKGGTVLRIDGAIAVANPSEEYERIYERFAGLLATDQSDADGTPLRLVADIFLLAERQTAAPFNW